MSTLVEQRTQPMGGYEYEHMRNSYGQSQPHFTNPWGSSTGSRQLYNHHNSPAPGPHDHLASQSYTSSPAAPSLATGGVSQVRPYNTDYSAPTTQPAFNATSAPSDPYSYASYEQRYAQYQQQQAQQQQQMRRPSYGMTKPPLAGRDSFNDALDGAQGMVAMSQQDFTPRNPYPPRNNSSDSYGFPSTSSDHGSVSSSVGSYPYYGSYHGSIDGSVGSSATEYSTSSEQEASQRTLPPPTQLVSGFPADATQMMTQFNSKLAASAQKKHKCKICDKRFTRPSSLQTHMYSHTGEKPFACDFEGCGRHFSVVSNLRRHKKCHKGAGGSVDSSSMSPEADAED